MIAGKTTGMTSVDKPNSLYIGLFGCTGIGKSSLINSLHYATRNQNVGATTRVQADEELTDTQITEEEEDHIVMKSLPHETGRRRRCRPRKRLIHCGYDEMAGVDIPDSIHNEPFYGIGLGKSSLLDSMHFPTKRRRTRFKLDGMTGVDIPDSIHNSIHNEPFCGTGIGKSSLLKSPHFPTKSFEKDKRSIELDWKRVHQLECETWKLRTKIQLESEMRSAELKKKEETPQWSFIPWETSGKQAQGGTSSSEDNLTGLLERSDTLQTGEDPPDDKFADILRQIADDLDDEANIDSLAGQLGILHGDIERALMTNVKFNHVTSDGTRHMLKQWRRGVSGEDERMELTKALRAAKLVNLADMYLSEGRQRRFEHILSERQTSFRLDEMAGVDIFDSIHNECYGRPAIGNSSLLKSLHSLVYFGDEVNVKPIKMECCKRVGAEGGKLRLDSFGIELEIPPGAIDSEAPQDFSLSVLTDTSNLGNSKEEMSVCFGVQCSAPDDLVLKLPVTYTIPHCAVITRYSSVEAVLYTGEGEYSPDAVVKERIMLSRSGIPSCTIKKNVLKLKMNHFSWAKIMFRIKNVLFREKRMYCRVFTEKNLALQKTPVILHAHLYDDIKGNSEIVKRQEEEQEFVPAYPEQPVLIQAGKGDLKMTCHVNTTVIGGPVVIPYDQLMSGARICEPFQLDFTNQPDIVAVSLIVGQVERLQVHLLFPLDFSTPRRTEGASSQDSDEPVGATPRAQVLKEWTDTQNTKEEDEEEEEEEEKYYIAMESLPNETDELVEATARVQVHEQQTDTQNTRRMKGGRKRKRGRRGEGRRKLHIYGKLVP